MILDSLMKLCSDPNERKDIWVTELGPGMHFIQECLFNNQRRSKHANCMHLDGFLVSLKTRLRSLYSHLGSYLVSGVRQSTIEHRFTLTALLFPQRPTPPINISSLGCNVPDETVAYLPRKQGTLSLNTDPLRLMLYRGAHLASSLSTSLGSNGSKLTLLSVDWPSFASSFW